MAHWRMGSIDPADIGDAAALLRLLQSSTGDHPVLVELRAAWAAARDGPWPAVEGTNPQLAERIASALRPWLDDANRAHFPDCTHAPRWPSLTRVGLERVLDERLLRRHRCLEFADGLRALAEFVAAVRSGFDGMLDLGACHSSFAIDPIKDAHGKSIIRGNRFPVDPVLSMLRYVSMIEELTPLP
jgi:hypothetical protein